MQNLGKGRHTHQGQHQRVKKTISNSLQVQLTSYNLKMKQHNRSGPNSYFSN